jgi:hypothetical protein
MDKFYFKEYLYHASSWKMIFVLNFFVVSSLFSQEVIGENAGSEYAKEDRLLVFLDCNICDNTFIRQQLNFVNYVRDPKQGQVHVFITTRSTASGGRLYSISFIGKGEFEGEEFSLSYTSVQTNTWDEEREGLNARLKFGLVPYLSQTSLVDKITVDISAEPGEHSPKEDSWNWMFEVYGGLEFAEVSRTSSLALRYGLFARALSSAQRCFWHLSRRRIDGPG